jgi:glycosyltransferase involved in cell wall biosynthesis
LTPQLSQTHGWGIYAYQLTLRLLARGFSPVLLCEEPPNLQGAAAERIRATIENYRQAVRPALAEGMASGKLMSVPFPVLHALHNDCLHFNRVVIGPNDVGSIFFENRTFSPDGLRRGRQFRRIIAGSWWNAGVLEACGLQDVRMCHQGIDFDVFFPGTRGNLFGKNRFVLFSGGQLHLRKAQDIVLAAFAAFHRRHSDALLVSVWHSSWPEDSRSLAASPHVKSLPLLQGGRMDMTSWAVQHGVPAEAFVDLGVVEHAMLGTILRSVDAAVFPNRGEGGTNLIAMECLATGLPCIIADNTGQKDLVAACPTAYRLAHQPQAETRLSGWDVTDWGESSVEEIVEHLEAIYTRRDEAHARGSVCARQMRAWNWPDKADAIIDAILEP